MPDDKQATAAPDPDALSPEDVRIQAVPNEGSDQYAVFDATLGQYVSGVGDKATATAAKKELESHNGTITEGHDLQIVPV